MNCAGKTLSILFRFNSPLIPTPPATCKAPVLESVDDAVERILKRPSTKTVPPIPTPPVTTKAPEVVDVDAVEEDTETMPPIVSILNLVLFDPSLIERAVVDELLRLITPVDVIVPVFVIAPLFKITPEIEEALEVGVNKLPPMPTPPDTTRAPVVVEPEAVVP